MTGIDPGPEDGVPPKVIFQAKTIKPRDSSAWIKTGRASPGMAADIIATPEKPSGEHHT